MNLVKATLVLAVFVVLLCIEDAHGAMRCEGFSLTDQPRKWPGWFVAIAPDGRQVGWRWIGRDIQVIWNGDPVMLDGDKCEKETDR